MSTKIDLGQVFLLLDGTWQQDKPYSRLTVVERNGSSYASLVDNIGKDPEQYTMVWMPIAKKGDKGDAFTYDDFTPEQIELLQRPATEAAELANQAVERISETETEIKAAESERQQAEIKRAQAEAGRVAAEQKRVVDFTKIVESSVAVITDAGDAAERANNAALTAETATNAANDAAQAANTAASEVKQTENSVKQAESLRVTAEQQRETHETERQQAEADRQLAEQGRATAEEDRVTAESGREAAEQQRESAEQSRVTEFAQLKQESETATNNANDAAKKANDSVANMLVKTEQALTPEEETQVQTNIGVKDTVDVVGAGKQQKVEFAIWKNECYRVFDIGIVYSSSSYKISNPIKINAGDRIVFRSRSTSRMAALAEIINNESHSFIRTIIIGGTNASGNYEYISDRDMYVEISKLKNDTNDYVIIQKTNLAINPYPKGGYNRALYEAAGAKFNENTGFYELNGLTDITEEQMDVIFSYGVNHSESLLGAYENFKGRTNLRNLTNPATTYHNLNLTNAFRSCTNIEIAVISKEYRDYPDRNSVVKISTAFYYCNKLRKVQGILQIRYVPNGTLLFNGNPLLEYILLYGLKDSIELKQSSKLGKESILYMIQNSAATSAITITLHPDAYAMAMADTDIQAALAEKTFVSLASA